MSTPVVIVTSGGIAVTESDNGIPVTVADNGYGIAVTVVTSGGMAVKGAGDPLAPGAPGALTNQSATTDVTPTIRIALNTAGGVLSSAIGDVAHLLADGVDTGVTRTLDATDVNTNVYAQITSPERRANTVYTAKIVRGAHVGPVGVGLPVTFDWDDSVGYGQSNLGGFMTDAASPGTPLEGTSVYNISTNQWAAPTGNGSIAYLNARKTATGRPQRMVYAYQNGVASSTLKEGDASGNFATLVSRIQASGANPVRALIYQGEGNAGAFTSGAGYKADWASIHQSLATALGKTMAQIPFIFSGLAASTGSTGTDASWQEISSAIVTGESDQTAWYFSHSPKGLAMVDTLHLNPASHAIAGGWFCQTSLFVDGVVATRPRFFLTGITRVDATHTDFTLVHSMGTDFTPTSAISNVEVSGDNGANWVVPSAVARTSATVFRATHSDIGSTQRLGRYGYGRAAISAPVVDNGTLTAPLVFTTADLVAAGASVDPVPVFQSNGSMTLNTTYERLNISVGIATASDKFLILMCTTSGAGPATPTLTVTPTGGGTPVVATRHVVTPNPTTKPYVVIWSCTVPGATTAVDVTSSMPGNARSLAVWSVPVNDMSSVTPVGTLGVQTDAVTVASGTIATSAGGFVIAGQATSSFPTLSITGTESYAMRFSASAGGGNCRGADAAGTAANATSTVQSNTDTARNHGLAAASWR